MSQKFLPFMAGEFDTALPSVVSTAHDEEFKPFMAEGYDENTTTVRNRQSTDRTPDIAAADMLLAERFGQPADMVGRNRDMFKNMEMDRQINEVLSGAPAVRGMYNSSNSHAALLRDDLENAVGLETIFASRQPAPSIPKDTLYGGESAALLTTPKKDWQPQGFLDRLPTVAKEGAQSIGHNVLSFIKAVGENMSLDPNAGNYVEGTARDEDSGHNQLTAFLAEQKQSMDANRLAPTDSSVQNFAEDFIRMGPQVAGQLATYALGGWVPSLLFAGAQIAGGKYSELTEDEAIDRGRAFLASLANAGLQAPLEVFAAGKALDVFKASGLGRLVKSGLGAMATEFFTEWAQKYPEALTTLWAEAEARGRSTEDSLNVFFDRFGEITKQGMYEGAVASVYGILGGSGKIAYEYGKYREGVNDSNFFAALDDSAKASKTRERLPKAYAQLVDNITTGGPVQNVYVAPQAMREATGDDAAFFQLAATVGVTQEAIARAEELGADLEIPLPLYQAHIAGTDVSQAIRSSVRFQPEDMSLTERMRFDAEMPQQLAEALRKVEADSAANAELDATLAPMTKELEAVYGKEAARANMDVLKARAKIASQWWTEVGEELTPTQIITDKWRLGLEVVGNEGAVGELQQAMVKAQDASVGDFAERISSTTEEKKSGFEIIPASGVLSSVTMVLPADTVRHKDNRHPNMTREDMDRLPCVLDSISPQQLGVPLKARPRFGGRPLFAATVVDGQAYGVIMELVKPDKALITTYFKDTQKSVDRWIAESVDAKKAVVTPAALWLAQAPPLGENAFHDQPSSEKKLNAAHVEVNTNPRGSISFADGSATIKIFRNSADISTFAHESAHLFVHDMQALVDTGNAPPQVVEDMEKLQAFVAEYDDAATLQRFYEQVFQPSRASFAERDFATLTQEEVTQVQNVAQQEKLADAFLTYLREGRAPSPELRSVFRRFKDWLKGLYQSVAGTVQINEDVRGVFDRMLATDADITLVESLHEQEAANAATVDKAGYTALWEMLTEPEARQLREAQREAGEQSREARLSKSLRGYMDSLLGKKEVTARAQKDIAAQPVYAAMDLALAEGGLSRESVVTEFGEDTAVALNKKQRGMVKKSGGLNVHDLAVVCDFVSAEDMMLAMLKADPKPKAVSAKVKEELAQREAALRQDLESGKEQAALAGEEEYYNDSRLAALLLELRAVERKAGRKVGASAGTAGLSRQWARDILGAMPVRDALHVGRHAAAEARAAAESAKALAEGRTEDAVVAKRKQAVNHAMVLEALELRKKQDALHKALRRWEKSKTMNFECREQIMALAQRYSVGGTVRKGISRFAPVRPDELKRLGAFMESLTEDDTFGMPPFSDFLLNESVPSPLTLEQLQETWDCMRWLAEQGSPNEAQLISDGVSGSVMDAATQGADVLRKSGNVAKVYEEGTKTRALSDKWRHLFASLNEFKDMMMRADGYQEIGPQGSHHKGFHSQWFQRLKESNDELSRIYRQEVMPEQRRIEIVRYDFIQRFSKSLGKRAASINGIEPPQNMKDMGRSAWTAEHIWCLARNMGNAGNLKTLHAGYGLSMADLRSLTSILTADEWGAIQAEGNLVGGFYERTDAVFRKVYGRPMPDKVQPQTLDVVTADGKSLSLEGWYFPIAVDGKLDPDVKDKGQVDMIQSDPTFTAFGPSLARNHTKGRSGTGKPVGLYFDVFERALQDQLRFMTHAPAIKDFDRITRNPEWRKAYVAAFGQQAYDQLRPKLKYLARPYGENQGALEGWIARSRQLATLYILGHNAKTFVRQFQGFSPAQTELGGGWIARGMGRVYRNPLAAVDAINELSPFMADRQKGYDRELRQALRGYKARVQVKVGGKLYSEQDVQAFTMGIITIGDCATVYPIWQGAYIKGQDKFGMGQKEAVAYADSLVQKTNASASPIDLTPIQQKDGLWRLFTMFMGEGLRKGSRMRYWWGAVQGGKIGMFQYAQHVAMESIVPALYFVALIGLLSDDVPEKEDFAVAVVSELIGPYPFLGSIPSALQYNKPLMQSPVFTGVEAAMKTVKSTKGIWDTPNDPEAWAHFYKSTADVAFFMAGVGNGRRLYETWGEGWEDLELGRTHNPFRLVFRKPKE